MKKRCTVCRRPKSLDQFYGDKRAKDGKKVACKDCHYLQCEAARQKNPEPSREKCRRWRAKYPDRAKSASESWHSRNRARVAESHRQWKARNPQRMKELLRVGSRNYKARKRAAEGRHTAGDIQCLYRGQNGLCACCCRRLGSKYHVDHVVPIARGGSNWPVNLQLLCPPCNHSKKDAPMEVFMKRLQIQETRHA